MVLGSGRDRPKLPGPRGLFEAGSGFGWIFARGSHGD